MSFITLRLPRRRRIAGAALAVLLAVAMAASPASAATAIGLGTAGSFAVLAGSGITNTGATIIRGDVGTFPTTSRTGFASVVLDGVDHGGDAVTQQAKQDLTTGYDQAAASTPATSVATELGGSTLLPGVYRSDTLGITGTLTLDTLGDPHAVFVFQAASTLITASASKVVVLGGAAACNVFWQVGSSATLGSDSTFVGSLLAHTSITADDGAVIVGRLLAGAGAVTLQRNTIDARVCAAGAGGTATDPVATTTTTTPAAAAAAADATGGTASGTSADPTTDAIGAAVPASSAGGTAASVPRGGAGAPPPGSVTSLPRTGVEDWLPLAGSAAIAFGLLLVRLGTTRVALRHAVRPRHLAPRSSR